MRRKAIFGVRSGWIGINDDYLKGEGGASNVWSSQAGSSTTNIYYLSFNQKGTFPSFGKDYDRWYGFPIRCLAR